MSLREQTVKGVCWTLLERMGTQGIGFCVTIILSRLLTPGDYGVIGMLAVFLSVSQMFIDAGFSSALIRKPQHRDEDFSTVFWFNLVIASVCYAALFAGAPLIARFYHQPILSGILRVLGLNLIVGAFYTVQVTRLTARANFRLQAVVSVIAAVAGGLVGVSMALAGCGAWALVGMILSGSVTTLVLYWTLSGWRPSFVFSRESFRELFGFGSKLLAANALHTVYVNLSPLIIGRAFSASDLGFYARGESVAGLAGGVFDSTVGRVVYPLLASIQDDAARLRRVYRKYLALAAAFGLPCMGLLACVAHPLVRIVFGEAWLPCAEYVQLLAFAWMLDPLARVALTLLNVRGRSDLVLKLEVVKKILAIAVVLVSIRYGIVALCWGKIGYSVVAFALNLFVAERVEGLKS